MAALAPVTISAQTPYDQLPEQLTVDEYATVARLCRATAYAHAKENKVPVVRYGRLVRILKTALRPAV